jgi:malonyl-CoA O-methyltransferase
MRAIAAGHFDMSSRPPENLFTLDRPGIRDAFERASASYEAAAVLQAQVNDELIDRLSFFRLEPQVVLDLGSGPGRGSAALKKLYPKATVVALDFAPGMLRHAQERMRAEGCRFESVCADAMRLPFADGSADLIFSNLMLQWCEPLRVVFGEVRRVVKPGGLFIFSTFGPDTLKELRASWAAVDDGHHVNRFVDMHDVGDAAMYAGLAEPVLDLDRTQLTYESVRALMRDLKAIGAHNVAASRARGLTPRAKLRRVEETYEQWRREGRLPATYEVVYGTAWGRAPSGARSRDGEVVISPTEIRRRG